MQNRPGKILCIIPAKGTSTRLQRKNVLKLAGKTLLERAFISARDSGLMDRIFVSTEDNEIANQAKLLGIDVPFLRPDYLSKDPFGVVDVALHVLDEWERLGEYFQTLVILLPTSPFRKAEDIHGALKCYMDKEVSFLHSVCSEEHSPLSSLILKDGFLNPLHPEWLNRIGAKVQGDTPKLVRANGAVTIVDIPRFREEKNYYAYPLGAYEMPWERSVDVDTEQDFLWAEFVAQQVLGRDA